MPDRWTWDSSLFSGTATYYIQGRTPYPPGLREAFASAADLSGSPRLIDVGCGPGTIALLLAELFTEVAGVDPDPEMLAEATRLAQGRGFTHARWVQARAEALPEGLGTFRYATFAQSFHWMDRDVVAQNVFELLEPGGAFVLIGMADQEGHYLLSGDAAAPAPLVPPEPPAEEIGALKTKFLGPTRRAGQGVRETSPNDEWSVLQPHGFAPARVVRVPCGRVRAISVDDVVARVFSMSSSAPHLFGDEVGAFEAQLRDLLWAASRDGKFSERCPDAALHFPNVPPATKSRRKPNRRQRYTAAYLLPGRRLGAPSAAAREASVMGARSA